MMRLIWILIVALLLSSLIERREDVRWQAATGTGHWDPVTAVGEK